MIQFHLINGIVGSAFVINHNCNLQQSVVGQTQTDALMDDN